MQSIQPVGPYLAALDFVLTSFIPGPRFFPTLQQMSFFQALLPQALFKSLFAVFSILIRLSPILASNDLARNLKIGFF